LRISRGIARFLKRRGRDLPGRLPVEKMLTQGKAAANLLTKRIAHAMPAGTRRRASRGFGRPAGRPHQ